MWGNLNTSILHNNLDGYYDGKKLSASMERYLEQWGQTEPSQNEFYTSFSYYPLKDWNTRRVFLEEISTIIKIKDTYYVYYTRSSKTVAPVGYKKATKNSTSKYLGSL